MSLTELKKLLISTRQCYKSYQKILVSNIYGKQTFRDNINLLLRYTLIIYPGGLLTTIKQELKTNKIKTEKTIWNF